MSTLLLWPSSPIRVRDLNLIRKKDPRSWRLQSKWNGHRMIVSTHTPFYMNSRHGAPLSSAAKTDFSSACARIFGLNCLIDGELLLPGVSGVKKPEFVIYDLPVHCGLDLTGVNYAARLAILSKYWTDFRDEFRIRVAHNIFITGLHTLDQLEVMVQRSGTKLIEGVVAKNLADTLSWSRISSVESTSQLKWRKE